MTKTPEELTADWKAGRLASGLYYVGNDKVKDFAFVKPNEISVYTLDSKIPMLLRDNTEILAPVPTYDEYKAMQDKIADASKKIEELEEQLDELEEANKQLEEDTGYGWHTAGIESDKNDELRGLLKECLAHLSLGEIGTSVTPVNILLTRINAALGESEE